MVQWEIVPTVHYLLSIRRQTFMISEQLMNKLWSFQQQKTHMLCWSGLKSRAAESECWTSCHRDRNTGQDEWWCCCSTSEGWYVSDMFQGFFPHCFWMAKKRVMDKESKIKQPAKGKGQMALQRGWGLFEFVSQGCAGATSDTKGLGTTAVPVHHLCVKCRSLSRQRQKDMGERWGQREKKLKTEECERLQ